MDYAQTYFGKPLAELQFADIEHFFIEERQESDQIEFKSYNANGPLEAKLGGLIEGITAFLNSSGGLLIWGAPEGSKVAGRKEKAFVGSLTKLPLTIEKDWLISKIADKIIPLPRGFRVQLVPTSDGQVAIFEIDESPYSPHQTSDKYYMRIDGQNKPAPHHYIEALFKKVSFPRLEAYIKPRPVGRLKFTYRVEIDFLFFNFSPFLNEEKLSFRIELGMVYFKNGLRDPTSFSPPIPGYSSDGQLYNSHSVSGIAVRYGFPYSHREVLQFEEKELERLGGFATISIVFGGKAAPVKFCRYHLQFSKDRTAITYTVELQNQLAIDILAETGRTDESMLKDMGVIR
jgi:hypothetical protein